MIATDDLWTAHSFASIHLPLIGRCGCFYCEKTFDATEVVEWLDFETTATCPHCRMDSVLPGDRAPIDPAFLLAMHQHWFGDRDEFNAID
jgi:hypothetical protein